MKKNKKTIQSEINKNMNKPVKLHGCQVDVSDNKVERALRILKKKVLESGHLRILQEKEFYVKPSDTRKREKAAAKKRWEKKRLSAMPTRR